RLRQSHHAFHVARLGSTAPNLVLARPTEARFSRVAVRRGCAGRARSVTPSPGAWSRPRDRRPSKVPTAHAALLIVSAGASRAEAIPPVTRQGRATRGRPVRRSRNCRLGQCNGLSRLSPVAQVWRGLPGNPLTQATAHVLDRHATFFDQ